VTVGYCLLVCQSYFRSGYISTEWSCKQENNDKKNRKLILKDSFKSGNTRLILLELFTSLLSVHHKYINAVEKFDI